LVQLFRYSYSLVTHSAEYNDNNNVLFVVVVAVVAHIFQHFYVKNYVWQFAKTFSHGKVFSLQHRKHKAEQNQKYTEYF
jgi:hypothetical protein